MAVEWFLCVLVWFGVLFFWFGIVIFAERGAVSASPVMPCPCAVAVCAFRVRPWCWYFGRCIRLVPLWFVDFQSVVCFTFHRRCVRVLSAVLFVGDGVVPVCAVRGILARCCPLSLIYGFNMRYLCRGSMISICGGSFTTTC